MVELKKHPLQAARAGGFTLIELTCAFAILGILASITMVGSGDELQAARQGWLRTLATETAASRLAELQADVTPVPIGTRDWPLPSEVVRQLPHAKAREHVTAIRPGLYRVHVEVRWQPTPATRPAGPAVERHIEMHTVIARQVVTTRPAASRPAK